MADVNRKADRSWRNPGDGGYHQGLLGTQSSRQSSKKAARRTGMDTQTLTEYRRFETLFIE